MGTRGKGIVTKREKWAFIAGIIEAKGCIHLTKRGRDYDLRIEVSHKDGHLINKLLGLCGGALKDSRNGSRVWVWRLFGSKAVNLLKQAKPYLVGKKDQAQIICRWDVHRSKGKRDLEHEDYLDFRARKTSFESWRPVDTKIQSAMGKYYRNLTPSELEEQIKYAKIYGADSYRPQQYIPDTWR
jgi:hypothetical protein